MSKLTVTLDATKLRGLVTERFYTNKEGKEVKVQEVKFELVPIKEPKTIYTSDKLNMVKTHFAAEIQTKEQREAREETNFIGEGVTIFWTDGKITKAEKKAEPIPSGNAAANDSEPDLPF